MVTTEIRADRVFIIDSDDSPKALFAEIYNDRSDVILHQLNSQSKPIRTSIESITQVVPIHSAIMSDQLKNKVKVSRNYGNYVLLDDIIDFD